MKLCVWCSKPADPVRNYCSWECHVEQAKAAGGTVHTPNNLPINCITADNTMLECEHGDHRDYIFPVEIEGEDNPDDLAHGVRQYPQTHALIYVDDCVAVTLYECNYTMWAIGNGEGLGGRYQSKHERLSEASRDAICAHVASGSLHRDEVRTPETSA